MHGEFLLSNEVGRHIIESRRFAFSLTSASSRGSLSNHCGSMTVDVSYKEWCGICMILMGLYGFIWVYMGLYGFIWVYIVNGYTFDGAFQVGEAQKSAHTQNAKMGNIMGIGSI